MAGNPIYRKLLAQVFNDGTDAVQGTFAQGSFVTIGSQVFSIGYTGDSATNAFTGAGRANE